MNKNKAILKELSLGSESAFEDLYKLYFKSSFDLALYITKSKYLSEETVSDVFALIWKNRSKLSDIKDWEAYLYIMVRNKAFYYRKKSKLVKQSLLKIYPILSISTTLKLHLTTYNIKN